MRFRNVTSARRNYHGMSKLPDPARVTNVFKQSEAVDCVGAHVGTSHKFSSSQFTQTKYAQILLKVAVEAHCAKHDHKPSAFV